MQSVVGKICQTGRSSKVCVILGSQWGDEGKGKLVDILAEQYDYCGRFNGGANAGHTVVVNKKKYAFHLLPCGILYPNCKNILGNGVVVHLPTVFEELSQLDRDKVDYTGRLLISDRAHLVTEYQLSQDSRNEGDSQKQKIGTTKRGIGPTYAAKAHRFGLRIGDLKDWSIFTDQFNQVKARYAEQGIKIDHEAELKNIRKFRDIILTQNMICDSVSLLGKELAAGKRLLAEGANACMLDMDHGTYPYVTSSTTNVGGVCTGLGVPPQQIETVIGIMKAYTTRVGEGPFPTELSEDIGASLQKIGREVGATTGRPRRCGWIDLPVVQYANSINGYTSLNMTKLDVLSHLDEIQIGVEYSIDGKPIDYMPSTISELEKVKVNYHSIKGWKKDISHITNFDELPVEARNYVSTIEKLLNIPIQWIGTGPEREAIILNN